MAKNYIVKRKQDDKSIWAFQLYESQIEKRAKEFGEFDIIIICDYTSDSEKCFRIPYSYLKENILPTANKDDKERWLFEVNKTDNKFNWHHKVSMDGSQFLDNSTKHDSGSRYETPWSEKDFIITLDLYFNTTPNERSENNRSYSCGNSF
ncbi:MAG: hypothetical protein V1701_05805 [Planctomycetota bacterium]